MRAVTLAFWALFILAATNAYAQRVSIDLRGDTVTLVATNATLDDILAEWSRSGGLKVVTLKGGAIGGSPMTMVLRDVTERQALEMLLRNFSGYVLSARRDRSTGTSAFEQLLILPTSTLSNSGIPSPATRIASLDGVASVGPVEEPAVGFPSAESTTAAESAAGSPMTDPARRPPTPLAPPPTAPDEKNPFGRAPGASRPGVAAPSSPPGVWYPPVTNPNAAGGFKPAGTP
jgi:hypothetical protein